MGAFHRTLQTSDVRPQEKDMLAKFEVVSLFSAVPLEQMLQHFDTETIALIRQAFSTMYFLYNGYFCDQEIAS
jgi:hypothetical protein